LNRSGHPKMAAKHLQPEQCLVVVEVVIEEHVVDPFSFAIQSRRVSREGTRYMGICATLCLWMSNTASMSKSSSDSSYEDVSMMFAAVHHDLQVT
jgi:hypothetical protein